MRNRIFFFLGILLATVVTMQAVAPSMKSYVIELPPHVLSFSLPEEIARSLSPREIETRFNPQDPSFVRAGFREIAGTMYDINGPFWVGAYGSLKFHFIVQKRQADFGGDITTLDGLEHYVRQWNGTIEGRAFGCIISQASLNGMPVVRREWNTFADPGKREPEYLEIFSLPLNDEIFLDVGFSVKEWEGGRGKENKWKAKAEALLEAIKTSVILGPRKI